MFVSEPVCVYVCASLCVRACGCVAHIGAASHTGSASMHMA